ncbi:MAG TPA: caspase family protein [Desulfobacteria bacterium]|nr:caspase family protein [Desulfobacteria bacterium]
MKIAVVIGISDYEKLDSLPACKNDAQKIAKLLKATGEYAKIVELTEDTKGRQIKTSLRTFFKDYNDKEIDEVLFYFSGHGIYESNKVFLCCSDFDPEHPYITSISNQEIDDYIRNISSTLAVKILDSCSSGEKYIKDTTKAEDDFKKAIKNTVLNQFICMASSGLDQSSYASDTISDFTKSFIEGVISTEQGEILYRDIQDYISDAFRNNPEQTPWFVTQGTGLEVFATVNTALKALKSTFGIGKEKMPEDLDTFIDTKIKEMESIFVPVEKVSESLEQLQSTLSSTKPQDPLVSKYYNYEIVFKNDLDSLVDMRTIATWAYQRKWNKLFFVDINVERVKRRATHTHIIPIYEPGRYPPPIPAYRAEGRVLALGEKDKKEDRPIEYSIENVPTSIKSTHPLAFEVIEIIAKPEKRALKQFGAMIGIFHSRTAVLVLSTTLEYKDVGWDERTIDASIVNWRLKELKWKDIVSNPMIIASDVLPQVEKEVSDYLKSLIKEEEVAIEQKEISEEVA